MMATGEPLPSQETVAALSGPPPEAVDEQPPPAATPQDAIRALLIPARSAATGRPTWLEATPDQVAPLLALFAAEGARLLALTARPAEPAADRPGVGAVDVRYHFAVAGLAITVSARVPGRQVPSAAGSYPGLAWRERELAGELGLRFVAPAPAVS